MSHRYEIVMPKPIHAGMLARRIREADKTEIEGLGFCDVRRVLRRLMIKSPYSRTGLIDDEIAAMWGVTGTLMSDIGRAWLFTSAQVEKMPIAFMQVARREVRTMLSERRELISQVAYGYDKSIRFFRLLGFTIGEPLPIGSGGPYYCSMSLKRGQSGY